MSLENTLEPRGIERREKRLLIPIVYFFAEVILVWLTITLIELNFNILDWDFWAIVVFIIWIIYSIIKTINVYNRQKDYPKAEKEWKGLKE